MDFMMNKTLKTRMTVGEGVIDSPLNSLAGQKISSSFKKISRNGFSLAEAMIVVLIGAIALGMSAPMISRQLKNESLTNTQMQILQRQIDRLKENQGTVPAGAIMFFNLTECPGGWTEIKNLGGYYPRIATFDDSGELIDTINSTKEQMVHRHKHISPILDTYNYSVTVNSFRYGPFRNNVSSDVSGDGDYEKISGLGTVSSGLLQGHQVDADSDNWYLFTSDGENRYETLKANSSDFVKVLTCPNKDENGICKKGNNSFKYKVTSGSNKGVAISNVKRLENMPLVGGENRPNSVIWLACQKNND